MRAVLGLLALSTLALAGAAHETQTQAHEQARCRVGKSTFEVLLGNDVKEDDPEFRDFGYPYVWIRPQGRKPVQAMAESPQGSFLFLEAPPGASSGGVCDKAFAVHQADGKVAILLKQNDRPLADQLAVIFYDPVRRKVVATHRGLGTFGKIEKTRDGFVAELALGQADDSRFPVVVKGKSHETREDAFSAWSRVKVRDGKVVALADADLTWNRSRWKPFFKSRAEFDRAFGLDPAKGAYSAVRVFSIDSSPPCLQATPDRSPKKGDLHWHCKPGS